MKLNEKKLLYIAIAALNYLLGSTWVLALYNDPSLVDMKSRKEWFIVGGITVLFTLQSAMIAWKAYTSNPSIANGESKEPQPPVQKLPAGEPEKPKVNNESQTTGNSNTAPGPAAPV